MYFLYRHIRLDKNIPFYIGIGKRSFSERFSSDYKRAFVKSQRTKYWKHIINISNYRVEILMEDESLEYIFKKEKEFISLYGRSDLGLGTLVNMTDGGDGGFNRSPEQRKIISQRMIGNKNGIGQIITDEKRRICGERFKGSTTWVGRKHKEESRTLISKAKTGVPLSSEHIKNSRNKKPNSKKVHCSNNGMVYNSICECVRLLFNCEYLANDNIFRNYKHQISFVCNGKKDNYNGYKFNFV